jgi:DNA modification methylase
MEKNIKTKLAWSTVKRKVSDLVPWDKNPRKLTEDEERNLRASLEKFNLMSIPVVNTDNKIVSGHQRVKILHLLGRTDETIDVRIPNRPLTEDEYKEAALRENQNVGSWDQELLKDMDMDLLLNVGFGEDELQALFDDVDVIDDEFDVEKALKETKVARVKPGEIWQLGDHRLLVGDSTLLEQIQKLMGTDLADVIYCDGPYNIGLDYSKGISTDGKYEGKYGGHSRREDAGKFPANKFTSMKMSDSKTVAKYSEFIDQSIKTALAVAKPNAHIFYWCDEKYIWLLQTLFANNKIDNKRVCLWIKNNFNMTPQIAFNKVYEPCVYGVIGKPHLNKNITNLNEILNQEVGSGNQVHEEILDIINLWIQKRDNAQEYLHPTQKPVTLNEKPLKRCSAPGHVVFSGFAGSGSDLIACEQLNRKWRGVEQDLIFATVCIDRWEAFSNKKAKLL